MNDNLFLLSCKFYLKGRVERNEITYEDYKNRCLMLAEALQLRDYDTMRTITTY